MSDIPTQTQGVDDPKASIISYSGPWTSIDNTAAYGGSLHKTTATGASATLSYTGSQLVTIVGGIQPCVKNISELVEYQVVMDGVVDARKTLACTSQFQLSVALYNGTGGNPGDNTHHVITISNLGPVSAPLIIDRFSYVVYLPTTSIPAGVQPTSTGSSNTVNANASAGTATQTVATGLIVTTVNGIATFTPVLTTLTIAVASTGADSSTVARHPAHFLAPVIGGVVGLVVVAVILFFIGRNRWRKRSSKRSTFFADKFAEHVSPFDLDSHQSREVAESLTNIHSHFDPHRHASHTHPSASSFRSNSIYDAQGNSTTFRSEKWGNEKTGYGY
ncbi:hypothetical protein GALMADRAFT_160711 [Galerina marginata CBS 339.88]|uniref:Uncharacterized protein n=1 Tax=Galerina marginata (strain CBS 339.88) TaxID=685588 RepID=A0A067SFV0_GALM3|nr:hypothetical protein GALMADRAFT_160711 [Galerina marginata CBS 339.88]